MNHATLSLDDPLHDDRGIVDAFKQASARYHSTIFEYCTLALQPRLSEQDEDRLNDILTHSIDDPLLSFWLDEIDHWVGQQLDLLPEEDLKHQQVKLRRRIGQTWVDGLWNDLQHRTKALQAYLQQIGLYTGAIDGIMGPRTQLALESFKRGGYDDFPLEPMGG
ncbi:MAG: peptidoglycan-binding protein [Nodosilinea sp.]